MTLQSSDKRTAIWSDSHRPECRRSGVDAIDGMHCLVCESDYADHFGQVCP